MSYFKCFRLLFMVSILLVFEVGYTFAAETKVVVIPLGSSGSVGIESTSFYMRQNSTEIDFNSIDALAQASCDVGDTITGGGFLITGDISDVGKVQIIENSLGADGTTWFVYALNNGASSMTLNVRIRCVKGP